MTPEDYQDLSGLAGLPLCLVISCFALLTGNGQLAWLILGGLALGYALAMCLKAIYFRPRPKPRAFVGFWQKIAANSFPSVHAMRAGVLWSLLAQYVAQPRWTLTCVIVIALVAWTRVKLGQHHTSDTLVGVGLGCLAGLAIFELIEPKGGLA